jgi:S1-C subfamily serine protease
MNIIQKPHMRISLVVFAALVATGASAAYAAARAAKAAAIGTGIVVVNTNLAYQGAAAAGTGMVLTSSGEILTNNHVIDGATTIKVRVPGTTHSYSAQVVGYDVSADVAVLQLRNASSLKTMSTADSAALALGAKVTAVGNAGGTGSLTSASGTVTGLNKSIAVQDDSGGSERLVGLIETNAMLQPGDSGGPLLTRNGQAVGMDTAGSAGSGRFADYSASDGYAIPINTALKIAKQIEAGTASAAVHIGATGFLGIGVESVQSAPFTDTGATSGLIVANIVPGGSAAKAGLVTGDVIGAVDGKAVNVQNDIQRILLAHKPGDRITIAFADQSGQAYTTTATLASGPPQ